MNFDAVTFPPYSLEGNSDVFRSHRRQNTTPKQAKKMSQTSYSSTNTNHDHRQLKPNETKYWLTASILTQLLVSSNYTLTIHILYTSQAQQPASTYNFSIHQAQKPVAIPRTSRAIFQQHKTPQPKRIWCVHQTVTRAYTTHNQPTPHGIHTLDQLYMVSTQNVRQTSCTSCAPSNHTKRQTAYEHNMSGRAAFRQ